MGSENVYGMSHLQKVLDTTLQRLSSFLMKKKKKKILHAVIMDEKKLSWDRNDCG